jgi:hypothetical protein
MSNTWRSPSCIQQFLPVSLERPGMDNTQFEQYMGPYMYAFRDFHVTVKEMIVDEKERKVSIWLSSSAETGIRSYRNEAIFILKCGEDGKAEWIGEFVDTNKSMTFFPKLREYLEKQSKGS